MKIIYYLNITIIIDLLVIYDLELSFLVLIARWFNWVETKIRMSFIFQQLGFMLWFYKYFEKYMWPNFLVKHIMDELEDTDICDWVNGRTSFQPY